jgi:transcriptional regulator with XRE-family HTH domain
MTKISGKIKLVRNVVGLTQTEFGKKIGATKNYVCQLESGRKTPGFSVLLKIANEFTKQPKTAFKTYVSLLADDYLEKGGQNEGLR